MTRWEYMSTTVRITNGQGNMPGFFARGQTVRVVSEDSQRELNHFGAMGWELVSLLLLELGNMESGPNYACAVLKRPVEATDDAATA